MFEFEFGMLVGGIIGAVSMGIYCVYLTSKHMHIKCKTHNKEFQDHLPRELIQDSEANK